MFNAIYVISWER